jgi:hypothetical protein
MFNQTQNYYTILLWCFKGNYFPELDITRLDRSCIWFSCKYCLSCSLLHTVSICVFSPWYRYKTWITRIFRSKIIGPFVLHTTKFKWTRINDKHDDFGFPGEIFHLQVRILQNRSHNYGRFCLSCLGPLVYLLPKRLNYLSF